MYQSLLLFEETSSVVSVLQKMEIFRNSSHNSSHKNNILLNMVYSYFAYNNQTHMTPIFFKKDAIVGKSIL